MLRKRLEQLRELDNFPPDFTAIDQSKTSFQK